MVCTKCIPNYAVWTTIFSSQRSIWRHCAMFLSLYLAFSSYFTLALAKFFCSLPSFRNQWLLAHRYFKRDSHSQARKAIKTKNKKRNKNRLPIGVPRAHTHTHTSCLFVRFFKYFFVLFWSYIDVHINITTATSTNGKSNQPKFLFGFFSASFYAVFGLVFLAAALRFDIFTTLAIKSNLFFVVVAVVDVVVLRLTGQKFVQPNLYVLVLNVAISSKCAHSSLCITSWQVQLKIVSTEWIHIHIYIVCFRIRYNFKSNRLFAFFPTFHLHHSSVLGLLSNALVEYVSFYSRARFCCGSLFFYRS